jgi:hypothetical protein
MKRRMWCALVLLCSSACSSTVSRNPEDYVGEYVFRPFNSDTEQFADFVILKKDLKAVEIRFSKQSGQVVTAEKRWYLDSPSNKRTQLVIGDFAHPVEMSGRTIKLRNNYDLGTYYEKVR